MLGGADGLRIARGSSYPVSSSTVVFFQRLIAQQDLDLGKGSGVRAGDESADHRLEALLFRA
jgi:hypothetical protein